MYFVCHREHNLNIPTYLKGRDRGPDTYNFNIRKLIRFFKAAIYKSRFKLVERQRQMRETRQYKANKVQQETCQANCFGALQTPIEGANINCS